MYPLYESKRPLLPHATCWISCVACWVVLLQGHAQEVPPARQELNISSDWRFVIGEHDDAQIPGFVDSDWKVVQLPHTWNALDGQDGGSNYYRGRAWYRKRVVIPAAWGGKRIFLTFNGANSVADPFINGVPLGHHIGGYSAFTYDITDHVKIGVENVIAALVSNAYDQNIPPLNANFTFCGGLYRDVVLTATSTTHISLTDYSSPGIYITQKKVSEQHADLQIKTLVRNDSAQAMQGVLQLEVRDAQGRGIFAINRALALGAYGATTDVQEAGIESVHLWNGRLDPYLYAVSVRIRVGSTVVDELSQPLGLRTFRMDPGLGFFLNDKPYDLHGASLHQGRRDKGFAISDADVDQDVGLLEEIGATFVRLAHYQHPQRTYSRCDQAGILAWTEIPLCMQVSPDPRFTATCEHQLVELIRQNYNHPSICCWGVFNEIPNGKAEWALAKRLIEIAHEEDPGRPTTGASFLENHAEINHLTDLMGFNKYYGWFIPNYELLAPWFDRFHAEFPTRPCGVAEYGVGGSVRQHEENPQQPGLSLFTLINHPHSEEYLSKFHEAVWPQLASRRYLWCKAVWALCDYPSDNQTAGDEPGIVDMGLVTADRKIRKDAFFYYKAQWSTQPVLVLASRRFTSHPRGLADIVVYTNLPKVVVLVNGKPLADHAPQGGVVHWPDVTLGSGENVIEASGSRPGEPLISDRIVWNAP